MYHLTTDNLELNTLVYFPERIFFLLKWQPSNCTNPINSKIYSNPSYQLLWPILWLSPKPTTASQQDGAQRGASPGLQNLLLGSFYTQLCEVLAFFIKNFPTPGPKPLLHNFLHEEYSVSKNSKNFLDIFGKNLSKESISFLIF